MADTAVGKSLGGSQTLCVPVCEFLWISAKVCGAPVHWNRR